MRANRLSLSNVFPIVLLLGLLGLTARNALDPDLWWHLRTGQWIVETGHIPHSDPFSFTRAGSTWVSHEWFTDILFYTLWRFGGAAALIIFSAVVTSAGFMLLYLRCLPRGGKISWAVAATAIGALASAASWGVRPQMFTFVLASLLLWLVERSEARPRLLLWIPALFLLWVNLHAGFALGLALLFSYGVGLALEVATGTASWRDVRSLIGRVALLLLACLALIPLNPSGAQLYRYPIDTLRSPGMRSFIGEWFSPDFHTSLYRPFLLVWLLLIAALASSRLRPKWREIVPLLLTSLAALDAVRHIPIFVLLAIPLIVSALPSPSSIAMWNWQPRGSLLRPFFNLAVIVLLAAFVATKWIDLSRNQPSREAQSFPQAGVAFLGARPNPGRLLVYYDWGGYALWKLYPQYRLFVDGRADLYGDQILSQFKTAAELRTGWQYVLDGWNVDTVFVPPSSALAQALILDPGWSVAFQDSQAIILLRGRSTPENAPKPLENTGQTVTKVKKCFPEPRRICETRPLQELHPPHS